MQAHTTNEAVVKNLIDADCSEDIIARFMSYWNAGKTQDSLRVLALHRASLLEDLHASRFKLDCLDYLIYQIRAEKKK